MGGGAQSSSTSGFQGFTTLCKSSTRTIYGKTKRKAFTLAEVLITLGIIGVVAAMTLPTLIQNYKKQEVVTRLKKIYSVMNQAIQMSIAEYGDVESWAADCGTTSSPACSQDEAIEWFKTYIGKHLQVIKYEKNGSDEQRFLVYLKDGSVLNISLALYDIVFYPDRKALNNIKSGINSFNFRFNPVQRTTDNAGKAAVNPTFEPYTYAWKGTRDDLINQPSYGCAPGGTYCAKLIQDSGWEIPDDYPYKF